MRVRVLYFAAARERAGTAEETVELPGETDVRGLRRALEQRHPDLRPVLSRCRVAIDAEFAPEDARVVDGAEIAVIPPVSGGAPEHVRLSTSPLSLDEAVAAVRGEDAGGLVTFTGAVRGRSRGRQVLRLHYEAFGPMAERKLAQIAGECRERFGARVSILHRTGTLGVGEVAVVIAAAAAHRAEAFDACRHAIERLKADVPIWKREHFADGTEWVGMGP